MARKWIELNGMAWGKAIVVFKIFSYQKWIKKKKYNIYVYIAIFDSVTVYIQLNVVHFIQPKIWRL